MKKPVKSDVMIIRQMLSLDYMNTANPKEAFAWCICQGEGWDSLNSGVKLWQRIA
jgi:hypothetical protein